MGVNGENKAGDAGAAPMQRLIAAVGANPATLPPVERWNPPWCGEIDMVIKADGSWFYMGTPIGRAALVKLFASVLKREDGRYVLVTPVEKVGIQVEDAPFQAVEMAIEGDGADRRISLRTNVDDIVTVGAAHAFRFELGADGGLKPYVHIRRDLWARLTRALTYDLIALGEVRMMDGHEMFGIEAGGLFHAAQSAGGIGDLT